MAVNLVELVKGYLTPDILQKAGSFVGESESATQKAMNGIVPTLIAAFANQASTTSGAEKLSRMIDTGKYDGSALNNLGSLFSGGESTRKAITEGKDILGSLLGNKTEGLVDQIARFAGIRTGSASFLLALAVPLIMNLLGRQRSTIGQSPSALAALLGEQKGFLSGLLPAGIGSLLGWTGYEATRPRETTAYVEPKRETPSWLIPAIVLGGIALVALAWLLNRPAPVREIPVAARPAAKMTDLQLPGGVKVSVPEGSFNYSLHQWLAGTTDTTVLKRFVFDNLNFETASTKLTPESVPTVDSLVAILKAYPNVTVSLEGHTDNTGDAVANKKLSLDRAVTVKEIMVQGGITEARIGTDGYGEEKPIAPNDTEEGRAKNRRTELVVEKRCNQFKPSQLATKYLENLHGIEIGASTQNSFGLKRSINVDFSDEQGGLWQDKACAPAVVNIVALGDDLPFKDNTLDYVLTSHVIEHFFDPIKALKEWHRVIKPGGYIFIIAPHKDRTFDKHRDVTPTRELFDRFTGKIKMSDYATPIDYGAMEKAGKEKFGPTHQILPHKLIHRGARLDEGWTYYKADDHHHWSVWRTDDFVELVKLLKFNIVETQDIDDKVGNGFTVVIRK